MTLRGLHGGPSQNTHESSGFQDTSRYYAGKYHATGNTSRLSENEIHLTRAIGNRFDNTAMSEKPGSSFDYND